MGGLNVGMGNATFIGCRVATQLGCENNRRQVVYIPTYNKSGKDISACCKITAFVNELRGGSNVHSFTAWGKLADACAKSMGPGKEFHCTARPESYDARVFDADGNVILKADGSPLTVRKTNFVITEIRFGADSEKLIAAEIAAGRRPPNYNDNGPGSEAFRTMMKAEHAKTYDGVSETYGHARVLKAAGGAPVVAAQAGATDAALTAKVTDILKSMSAGVGDQSGNKVW